MRQSVNRCLKDKSMGRIDHALGRPVNPLGDTFRDHFATDIDAPEAYDMARSPYWHMGRKIEGGMVFFHVTKHGRIALSDHLQVIGDKHRQFIVIWDGYEMPVIAETPSKARYSKWVDINDALPDLTFQEFLSTARVRLAS
ncbi:hypothetical protein [uncultured Ruegeria sp.]|uniref:hypothetical protein n=1 Tax=uncultured Ruegeria sp. TaxID=259304 RepID=UPI0026276C51|nr:hypothetical protein [uncultured Ruegeria sp.]